MISIILLIIAGIVVPLVVASKAFSGDRLFKATLSLFFVMAIGGLLVLPPALFLGSTADQEGDSVRYELKNLTDGSQASSSFFLGIGSIDEEDAYSFYYQRSDGFAKRMTITTDADNEILIDQSDEYEQPYAEKISLTTDSWLTAIWPVVASQKRWIFRVPEGSIKEGVVLDAENG